MTGDPVAKRCVTRLERALARRAAAWESCEEANSWPWPTSEEQRAERSRRESAYRAAEVRVRLARQSAALVRNAEAGP